MFEAEESPATGKREKRAEKERVVKLTPSQRIFLFMTKVIGVWTLNSSVCLSRENKWGFAAVFSEQRKLREPSNKSFSLGERERGEREAVVWTLNSSVCLCFLYFRVREREKIAQTKCKEHWHREKRKREKR